MFQARDLHTLPRPPRPPYMSCRESTRALHEPPAATFLDVTVMTGLLPPAQGKLAEGAGMLGSTDQGSRPAPPPFMRRGTDAREWSGRLDPQATVPHRLSSHRNRISPSSKGREPDTYAAAHPTKNRYPHDPRTSSHDAAGEARHGYRPRSPSPYAPCGTDAGHKSCCCSNASSTGCTVAEPPRGEDRNVAPANRRPPASSAYAAGTEASGRPWQG